MFDTILTKENEVKLSFWMYFMPLSYPLEMRRRDHMYYKCNNDWSSVSSFSASSIKVLEIKSDIQRQEKNPL